MTSRINASLLFNELKFSASRSGGPGGQNVNKVNSKVTLKFDVVHSRTLSDEEKTSILTALSPQLTNDGVLILSSQERRSQLENKEDVIRKFEKLIAKAFAKKKVRMPTKPSKSAVSKRITSKKLQGEKKKWRRTPE